MGTPPRSVGSVQQLPDAVQHKKTQKKPRKFSGRLPKLLVHKRSGQSYVVDPGPPRKQIPMGLAGSDTALANYRRWVARYLLRKAPQVSVSPTAPTKVAGLFGAWLDYCRTKYRRPDGSPTSELAACRRAVELVEPYTLMGVDEFSRAQLLEIRDHCLKTMARKSTHIMVDRIVRAFRWGESRDWIDAGHVARLENWERLRPTEGRDYRQPRETRPRELFKLYRHLAEPWRSALAWHVFTGQRVETALGVRVQDLNRETIPWEYRPAFHKNAWRGQKLVILVGPRARNTLGPRVEGRREGLVFESSPCGKATGYSGPITHAGYRRALARACKRAGIKPPITGRCVRHAAASYLLARGVPMEIIGAILGHSTGKGFAITANYARIHRDAVAKAVERFG
jgi:integrase